MERIDIVNIPESRDPTMVKPIHFIPSCQIHVLPRRLGRWARPDGRYRPWPSPPTACCWSDGTGSPEPTVSLLTSNPAYPNSPSTRTYTTVFEIPMDVADNYGTRTRGYVTPPTTGNYTFWIAGDDNCELWLSTDANPANIRRIAFVSAWTTSRQWTKFPEQQSAAIALNAGTRYYIETRHKEGGGERQSGGGLARSRHHRRRRAPHPRQPPGALPHGHPAGHHQPARQCHRERGPDRPPSP